MKATVGARGRSRSEGKMIAWLRTDICLLETLHGCQNHLTREGLALQLSQPPSLEELLWKRFSQMIRPKEVCGSIIKNLSMIMDIKQQALKYFEGCYRD